MRRCAASSGSTRVAPTMRVTTNGVELWLHEAGPTDGPVVILLHGFPELGYSWRHQIPALAEAGYRVLTPDLRGFGRSDAPEPVEAYARRERAADGVGRAGRAGG